MTSAESAFGIYKLGLAYRFLPLAAVYLADFHPRRASISSLLVVIFACPPDTNLYLAAQPSQPAIATLAPSQRSLHNSAFSCCVMQTIFCGIASAAAVFSALCRFLQAFFASEAS